MGSNAYKIKWPSGRETIVREEVLIDAATAAKSVLDVLGGDVLVVVDMRYRPRDYRSAWGDGAQAASGAVGSETSKRVPVPLETGSRMPSSQGDLLTGWTVERDSVV
jgi:hypothetical protein